MSENTLLILKGAAWLGILILIVVCIKGILSNNRPPTKEEEDDWFG